MTDSKRKSPHQPRAQSSVSYVLEAAAQLLDRSEIGSVTTNHVAERAGVSIGTVYRYFRDKDDIFETLARTEIREVTGLGLAVIRDDRIRSGDELIERLAALVATPFDHRPLVRRNLHRLLGYRAPIARRLQETRLRFCGLIERRLSGLEPNRFRALSREERRCIVIGWRGIVDAALDEDPSRLAGPPMTKLLSGTVVRFFEK